MGFDFEDINNKEKISAYILQEIQDTLEGGIRSNNMKSFRNTYVINAQDSLDATYPMYVHFNIIDEMVKIVSVKVDFWVLNYRAYSKAGASGGGQTSSSGGGQTTSATGSASGGGATSGAFGSLGGLGCGPVDYFIKSNVTGYYLLSDTSFYAIAGHTHTTPNHTHPTHSHTVANHTHTVDNHTHDAVYGIFEEDTSPTIKFYVSENAGVSYSDVFGGYTTDKSAIDITSLITTAGSKLIKFESDVRARLSVQIEIKLDIKAR